MSENKEEENCFYSLQKGLFVFMSTFAIQTGYWTYKHPLLLGNFVGQ